MYTGVASLLPIYRGYRNFVQPMEVVSPGLLSAGVQLLVSGAFATVLVQLLLVRQNRRKIDGEASSSEANAASQLSGAALTMVTQANLDAKEAKEESSAARAQTTQVWNELSKIRMESQAKDVKISILIAALEGAHISIPTMPDLGEPPAFDPRALEPPMPS